MRPSLFCRETDCFAPFLSLTLNSVNNTSLLCYHDVKSFDNYLLTGPFITPLKETPCFAVISAASLKVRETREAVSSRNNRKLFMSPEKGSVVEKGLPLKN